MARGRGQKFFSVETKFQSTLQRDATAFSKALLAKVVRPGAYAGANLIYQGMRINVPVGEGTLRDSIYHWHDDKRSRPDRHIYVIGPNKVKAPHWHHIEFGHWLYNKRGPAGNWLKSKSSPNARGPGAHDLPGARESRKWVGPRAFIRPTWDSYGSAALTAVVVRMSVLFRELKT